MINNTTVSATDISTRSPVLFNDIGSDELALIIPIDKVLLRQKVALFAQYFVPFSTSCSRSSVWENFRISENTKGNAFSSLVCHMIKQETPFQKASKPEDARVDSRGNWIVGNI